MGKVIKLLSYLATELFIFLLLVSPTYAQEDFYTTYTTTYQVQENGSAQVIQEISLENLKTESYAKSYTLSVEGKKPSQIKVLEENKDIPFEVQEDFLTSKIIINFPDALVGREKTRVFTISYLIDRVASKNGEVWDVTIPKVGNPETISEYKLTVLVPRSFGNLAYISPEPYSKSLSSGYYTYQFEKNDLVKSGVVAAFGEFQTFSFDLTYHIQNPTSQGGETEIALVPDTAYQRVFYEDLNPRPLGIRLDDDGNWLAGYFLKPGQELEIKAKLKSQIFASPQEHYLHVDPLKHPYLLSQTENWQTSDPEIAITASILKTPRQIYDFVVSRLEYDYSRVRGDISRFGAKNALANPTQAICMEFTDLFVALSRAAGIPAREINGYAYTENPELQPLSLVADVLHSWPEYWDSSKGMWRPVDPTWEDTTGGVDFFNKFDLSHVTFVIHGKDSNYPYPAGSYKSLQSSQKDVLVEFESLPEVKTSQVNISFVSSGIDLPFKPIKRKAIIYNSGPVALYNLPVLLTSSIKSSQSTKKISFLAPFSSQEVELEFDLPLVPSFVNTEVSLIVGEQMVKYDIPEAQIYLIEASGIFAALLLLGGLVFGLFHLGQRKR